MLTLNQFDYHLPKENIAQSPAEPRDSSRLLVLNRETGEIQDSVFSHIVAYLPKNALLVRNNTKVIPARIHGTKTTGGAVELLLTKRVTEDTWQCLTKPGLKPGQTVVFARTTLTATCAAIVDTTRHITFSETGHNFFSILNDIGSTPIPPYISWSSDDNQKLREVYQTTYAKIAGSAAAPTAGLHFTPAVDEALRQAGIEIAEVTLHVGLGTFLRVKTEDIADHTMHHEVYEMTPQTAEKLNAAKQAGRPIIAVGTTTTRVLETLAQQSTAATGEVYFEAKQGETDLYVYPPTKFLAIDGMITNFHEPKSTLLMLVSAFCTQPNTSRKFSSFSQTTVGQAYAHAIAQNYRMLSFGDAMLIQG